MKRHISAGQGRVNVYALDVFDGAGALVERGEFTFDGGRFVRIPGPAAAETGERRDDPRA